MATSHQLQSCIIKVQNLLCWKCFYENVCQGLDALIFTIINQCWIQQQAESMCLMTWNLEAGVHHSGGKSTKDESSYAVFMTISLEVDNNLGVYSQSFAHGLAEILDRRGHN